MTCVMDIAARSRPEARWIDNSSASTSTTGPSPTVSGGPGSLARIVPTFFASWPASQQLALAVSLTIPPRSCRRSFCDVH